MISKPDPGREMHTAADTRDLIARAIDAYNRKDERDLGALYHPEISYWSSLGDEHHGKAAVLDHIRTLFRELPDERMRALTIVTDGDTTVVEFESTGRAPGGGSYTLGFTEVIEVKAGLLAGFKVYLDPDEVAAAMKA